MEKTLEVEPGEEDRGLLRPPKKRRRKESSADYDYDKIRGQFGGVFQGR
jgi:hypothetical protein